jgi:copper chaperone CopZ
MKSLILSLTLLALPAAFAESTATTFTVTGMHCAACKESIEAKVCKAPGIATCKVEITNRKKETGTVTLTPTEGQTIDTASITKIITDAGYEAKLATAKK